MQNNTTQLTLAKAPTMKTQMLIRKSAREVFEAFTDPLITTKFWFTKSSGALKPGAEVTWEWEMYKLSIKVKVKEIEQDKRIVIEWNADRPTTVAWRFSPQDDDTTFVTITESGFAGSGDKVVTHMLDSMGGFSFLLAGAKAYLEHGIALNMVADHAPTGVSE